MSDIEVAAAATAVDVVGGKMDINAALQEVLKKSLIADGLVHGIHQACKALDNCDDEPQYKKLITALSNEHQIPLIRVDFQQKSLVNGQVSAQSTKMERHGRRKDSSSVVVITDFGEETPALEVDEL